MKNSIITLTASLALIGGAQATFLAENFESYSALGDSMAGKGNWQVSGNSTGPDGDLIILDSSNWVSGGDQAAVVGGITPTTLGLTSLYDNTLDVPFVGPPGSLNTFFSIETMFVQSTVGPNNAFQITLDSTLGTLFNIGFTPVGGTTYSVSWSSPLAAGGGIFGSIDTGDLTSYRLELSEVGAGIDFLLTSGATNDFGASGTLAGASATDQITGLSLNLSTFGGAGNGYLIADNINVIPEPSSALLGLLGASFVFLRRRRA